jgi:hypothetical protein
MIDETKISFVTIFVFVILISLLVLYGILKLYTEDKDKLELRREYKRIMWMLSNMENIMYLKGSSTSIMKCKAFRKLGFIDAYEDFKAKYDVMDDLFEEYNHVILSAKECEEKMKEYKNVSETKMSELTYLLVSIVNLEDDLDNVINNLEKETNLYDKSILENHICLQIKTSGVKRLYMDYIQKYGSDDKLLEYEREGHDISSTLWTLIVSDVSCIVDTKGIALVGSMTRKIDKIENDLVDALLKESNDELERVLQRYGILDQMREYKRNYEGSLMFEYMLLKMNLKSEDIRRIIQMV